MGDFTENLLGLFTVGLYMKDKAEMTSTTWQVQSKSFTQTIWQSFTASLGAIVFGMEDGTVSIFGLVFGVAASTTSSHLVLLAGATGAISAAVSMMAGTYLDVSTERDQAQAAVATKEHAIQQNPQAEAQKVQAQFKQAGFNDADTQTIMSIIQRTP